ncbi:MAG TPA: L,D-transpeptidase family protein [Steroidobacteraceae bacterium]|nr:L,D-transpeptidase family protein [Steroidobacteraceae bacterium]
MKPVRLLLQLGMVVLVPACSLLKPPPAPPPPPVVVEQPAPPPPPPPPPQYSAPLATHRFEIDAGDDVVGELQVTVVGKNDTLSDIARRFDIGYQEIVRANPGVDPWLPGVGREVVVPTQFVLPLAQRQGIVVNIAAMRVYYFPPAKKGDRQVVYTYPIGIGKVGWSTPEGKTKVVSKQKDPVWVPPESVRKEHKEERGEILPAVVPAGPDNPLGKYKFTLSWPGYLIHGTNKPYGVGLRSSHGCIRLYPEDVEQLFGMVDKGTPVTVVNQPFVFGWHQQRLYLQAYDVLEDDKRDWGKSRPKLLSKTLSQGIQQRLDARQQGIDWQRVAQIARAPLGLVLAVTQATDSEAAVIAAAPRVENRVPEGSNWDGADDPALAMQNDVQEMVGEQRQAPRS